MLFKLIGQFIMTAAIFQLLPADAAYFEWQAGVGEFPVDFLYSEVAVAQIPVLPDAEDREVPEYPVKVDTDSYGIVTSAESALVVDAVSGMTLLAKHPYQVRSIGSVTKLMSALVFMDTAPDLSQIVTLDPALDLVEGGRVYLAFYDGLTLDDVLGASLVGSDNTATEALIRFSGLAKEDFVELMNQKAVELGMIDTEFTDPTGIDPGNISTASDLVKLLVAVEEIEILKKYMTTATLTVEHLSGRLVTIENTNQLLESFLNEGEYEVTAGKTGYLPQAGYVLTSAVEQAGNKIYVIVLGSDSKESRVQEVKGLASWAFRVFKWPNSE
ncbi:MAG: serine hydrolase [bacterium]